MADHPSAHTHDRPLTDNTRGIIWGLLAAALFAVAAAMAKLAVDQYHVLQILFFRQLVMFLSSAPSIAKGFPETLKTRHIVLHATRLTGAFIALSCGIWAVAVLPLTTATTLAFAQVFFVALLAWIFLQEQVGQHRILAVLAGFVGVLIVMRPGMEGVINLHTLIPVFGALGAGVAITAVRKLSQTESTATLLAYQSIFVGALAGFPLFWFWTTPDLADCLFLLAMGVVATAGQWAGVRALRTGEASVVANMDYSKLIYATVLGFVLFGEVPDFYTLVGAAVIIASSAYIFHREAAAKRLQRARQ